jgi:O-antigen/teichoic acid export membrane protein
VDSIEVQELWKKTGFHRPLAGFWWNYSILLVLALPGILVIGIVLPNYILPFPEALGFSNVVTTLLGPLYLFADFGIKEAVSRFISQYSETNPKKAIDYMSFYFYYQMWTGLVQVSIVSWLAINTLPYTDISYAGWMFLVYILIQWPGTPGLFLSALGGFQQFAKQNVLVVIQNVVFQTLTQVLFIYLGRYVGSITPTVGELMGATMGFIVGSYVDDFIAMVVGGYMFSKVIKPFGMRLREVLVIRFDKKLVKEVLVYGGKVLPSGLSYVGVNAAITFMLVAWFKSYSTYVGLYSLASGLIGALGVSFSISEPISQAYNNGKKELSLFYIRSQLQWWGVISIGVLMAPLLFLIPGVLGKIAGEYAEVKWMIFPLFLGAFILFPTNFSGMIVRLAPALDLHELHRARHPDRVLLHRLVAVDRERVVGEPVRDILLAHRRGARLRVEGHLRLVRRPEEAVPGPADPLPAVQDARRPCLDPWPVPGAVHGNELRLRHRVCSERHRGVRAGRLVLDHLAIRVPDLHPHADARLAGRVG